MLPVTFFFFREEVQRTSSKSEEIHSHVGKNRFFWCVRFWFGSGFSFWLGSGSRLDRIYLLQLHTSSQYIQLHKKTECAQLNHPGKVQRCGSGSMRKKFGFRRNIRIRHMQYHCIKNTWKVTGKPISSRAGCLQRPQFIYILYIYINIYIYIYIYIYIFLYPEILQYYTDQHRCQPPSSHISVLQLLYCHKKRIYIEFT